MPRSLDARAGISLVEVVIGIALVAILASVLVPNMLGRLAEAESARLASDMEAIGKAARLYRLHVRRWPGMVEHLTRQPDALAEDPFGTPVSAKYLQQWNGPYLELVHHPVRDGSGETMMRSSRGTLIRNRFTRVKWQGEEFLQLQVDAVTLEDAREISQRIDGDTAVVVASELAVSESAGRVRWLGPVDGGDKGRLLFLAVRMEDR